jgi:hypothetical protein
MRLRTKGLHFYPLGSFANRGRWFQELIDFACVRYQLQGRAFIWPVPVHMRLDRGGQKAFFERKSTTDYLGFLEGRGVAFDAKSTRGREWGSGIPDNQIETLRIVHDLGHISGILVGFWDFGTPSAVWVPWPAANELRKGKWTKEKLLRLEGAVGIRWAGIMDFLPALGG